MAAAPPIIEASLWRDPKIECSIFGTADPEAIWEQAREACPDALGCFAFKVSIGALFGLELRDGSSVALKIHTDAYSTEYLAAAQAVQEHLWRRGFPCPRPLSVRGRATLEEWREDGVYRDGHRPEVRRALAATLARLVELTDELRPLPRLQRGFVFHGALRSCGRHRTTSSSTSRRRRPGPCGSTESRAPRGWCGTSR